MHRAIAVSGGLLGLVMAASACPNPAGPPVLSDVPVVSFTTPLPVLSDLPLMAPIAPAHIEVTAESPADPARNSNRFGQMRLELRSERTIAGQQFTQSITVQGSGIGPWSLFEDTYAQSVPIIPFLVIDDSLIPLEVLMDVVSVGSLPLMLVFLERQDAETYLKKETAASAELDTVQLIEKVQNVGGL